MEEFDIKGWNRTKIFDFFYVLYTGFSSANIQASFRLDIL